MAGTALSLSLSLLLPVVRILSPSMPPASRFFVVCLGLAPDALPVSPYAPRKGFFSEGVRAQQCSNAERLRAMNLKKYPLLTSINAAGWKRSLRMQRFVLVFLSQSFLHVLTMKNTVLCCACVVFCLRPGGPRGSRARGATLEKTGWCAVEWGGRRRNEAVVRGAVASR